MNQPQHTSEHEQSASVDLPRTPDYDAWPIEVPIVFTERDTGESKMSKSIVREAIWKVWKLRFLDLAGRL